MQEYGQKKKIRGRFFNFLAVFYENQSIHVMKINQSMNRFS